MWSSLFVEVEDLEKKKDKEPVKLVDMENEEINKTNGRLFDEAFISTNEEVQVGERIVDCPTRWSLWYWYLDFYVDHLVGGCDPI